MKTEIEQEQTKKTEGVVKLVLRKQVMPDPEQPRKEFNEEKLKGLAENITAVGIRMPLLVTGTEGKSVTNGIKYFLVDGERRWRAAGLAGIERVPVMVVDTSAPDWEKQKRTIQVSLNQQHENLTALEEAAALAKECAQDKADEVAKRHGMSRGSLFSRLRLLDLTEGVKKALLAGEITPSVAGLVAMVPGEGQSKFLREVTVGSYDREPLSFRKAQELLERNYARALPGRGNDKTAFDTTAEYKWEKGMMGDMKKGVALACEICPRRSGNMEGSGLKNANVCTEPRCFELKTKAAGALKAELARKQGRTVLEGKEGAKLFSQYGDEEVQHGSGFVELDKRADVLGCDEKKTYRDVLGHNLVGGKGVAEMKVVVAIDREGRARELVARAEAVKVLKECGKIKPEKASASQAKWEKQRKAEEEKRQRVKAAAKVAHTELVLTASRPVKEMDAKFLQKLCLLAFEKADVGRLEKRPKFRETAGRTNRERFENYVLKGGIHPAEENLVGLLVDCLVEPEVRYDGSLGDGFESALDLFGVKLEEKEPKATKGTKAGKKMAGKKMGKGKKGAKKS